MAFFKFRKAGAEPQAAPDPAESIEAMRRRARHRLIGAGVLVLVGVIGFPLLFDTQPRPISVDIPIEIPDRNKIKPLPAQAAPVAQAAPASAAPPPAIATTASNTAATPSSSAAAPVTQVAAAPQEPPKPEPAPAEARPEPKSPPKAEARPETKAETKAETKPEPRTVAKAEAKPEPRPSRSDDGSKAQALLEGKPVEHKSAAAEGRFVVQVGAFADASKARETRLKVEKAGLKTYTHVAETKEGKRIRVRVGPFGTRAEAESAAGKIKGLDLPAAILTL